MLKSFYRFFLILSLLFIIGVAGVAGLFFYYAQDLPDYSKLAEYHPPLVTRIYSRDGKLMEEYAYQHRVFVPISNMPRSLIEAFVAAEDKNFFSHPGVDITSIFRAAVSNISYLAGNHRIEGGSTITQQVVKNFLLTPEKSIARKIKEAILSYMISTVFTKEQILELYMNQIFLGKSAYGVAAAAQHYFNKSVEELSLEESALIAGLPQAPSTHNPFRNYEKAKMRRDYVINRMLEDGYISEVAATKAINQPIVLAMRNPLKTIKADYYAEQVREEVIKMFGKENFYTEGYTIITSLESSVQNAARQALVNGIRQYDKSRGFRSALTQIDTKNWQQEIRDLPKYANILEYKLAVILKISNDKINLGLEDGTTTNIALSKNSWIANAIKSNNPKSKLKIGDVVAVSKQENNWNIEQIPIVNGGIIAMNVHTGQVLALHGGYDFKASKFNRATQALRQPGSLMKPFVYLTALEKGIEPNTIFLDGPVSVSQGPGMPAWQPKNFKGDFLGNVTMRRGLEKSRNLVTVRVAQAVGLRSIIDIIKRFGINDNPKPFYSMILGSLETTLEKMVTAYGIIANQGEKIAPHYIELIKDRYGKVIYRRDKRPCFLCTITDEQITNAILPVFSNNSKPIQIIDKTNAYQLTNLLEGAVQNGTGWRAKKLNKVIAGKTGTTNNSFDTWFVGFTPNVVVGTYIGYDTPKELGKTASGANVASPVFVDFMEHAYKDQKSIPFRVPDTITLRSIDKVTGEFSEGDGTIMEAFKNDLYYRYNADVFLDKNTPQIHEYDIDQSPFDMIPNDNMPLSNEEEYNEVY